MKIGQTPHFDEAYIITTHDELIEFLEWQKDLVSDTAKYMIQNSVSPDRWDHVNPFCLDSIHSMVIFALKYRGTAPYLVYDEALQEYAQNLFDVWDKLEENHVICINMAGGHNTLDKNMVTDIRSFIPNTTWEFKLGDSPHMVIENDLEVDKWYVENVPNGFSYITSLGKLSFNELSDCFSKFNKKYPEGTLWIHSQVLSKSNFKIWLLTARANNIVNYKIHPSVPGALIQMQEGLDALDSIGTTHNIEILYQK